MSAIIFADAILVSHVLYVSVVIGSVPLIVLGGLRGWNWVHNFWFRSTHLLMITIVIAETLLGIQCPLTMWEGALRSGATNSSATGEAIQNQDFIATWLDRLLFWRLPQWVFLAIYVSFGMLVLSLMFIVPMRRKRICFRP